MQEFSRDLFQNAFKFATDAHKEQVYPSYPSFSYIYHLVSVAITVLEAGLIEKCPYINSAVSVALLHDILEDTDTTFDELKNKFGQEVATGVMALTLNETISIKTGRIKDSLQRIKKCNKWVWKVKLSDRINNLGVPPIYWDSKKKLKYLDDAKLILVELSEASDFLASKLGEKIVDYKKYLR